MLVSYEPVAGTCEVRCGGAGRGGVGRGARKVDWVHPRMCMYVRGGRAGWRTSLKGGGGQSRPG